MLKHSIQEKIDYYYRYYEYEFKNFNDIVKFCNKLHKDQLKFKHLEVKKFAKSPHTWDRFTKNITCEKLKQVKFCRINCGDCDPLSLESHKSEATK